MTGTVIKSTGSHYEVMAGEDLFTCRLRGSFRKKGGGATNPLVVGDMVDFDAPETGEAGMITRIHDRKNYIIRKATKLSSQVQVIAANLDLALVLATPVLPRTSAGFIDRFLATAEAYSIPAGIIFNKSDLYDDAVAEHVRMLSEMYTGIGYRCFSISALTGKGLGPLRDALRAQVTLLTGHSGTGKSTLINALVPGLGIRTSQISETHLKGTHTTTFAEMHPLPGGGYLIDTPGIREFGVVDFDRREVYHFFPEIFKVAKGCRFYNCMHVNEKDCAVLQAVEQGGIHPSRYHSYLSIYHNEDVFS